VRAGDNCYGWSDSYPAWTEVTSGYEIADVKGMYFQVAAELLPDGMGKTTPSITQLTLNYTEAELPLPPFIVNAESGDGQVTLTWSYSVDETAAGYYVYYGTRPGEYLGRTAVEGASPVKAGNTTSITLTGLKNGTIYYFAVSSYSSIDGRLRGELSREVYARPSKHLVKR
ncbi:MAG: fibronectin type III domain-containing protein, partial [Treponema sp.]|nr:fibronectin type III domain-containing protein [Treponema sp.]